MYIIIKPGGLLCLDVIIIPECLPIFEDIFFKDVLRPHFLEFKTCMHNE